MSDREVLILTAEQIDVLRNNIFELGHMIIGRNGDLSISAVERGIIDEKKALCMVAESWNDLFLLLDEVSLLAEDHARMSYTLRTIDQKVSDTLQGTSRSEIAKDWWQDSVDQSNSR